jgi:hypothetical protein
LRSLTWISNAIFGDSAPVKYGAGEAYHRKGSTANVVVLARVLADLISALRRHVELLRVYAHHAFQNECFAQTHMPSRRPPTRQANLYEGGAVKGYLFRWCLAILIALGYGFGCAVKPRSREAVRRTPTSVTSS